MKAQLTSFYDDKHLAGHEVEIDKVLYDEKYVGHYKVRVVKGLGKNPTYLSINWIVKVPKK